MSGIQTRDLFDPYLLVGGAAWSAGLPDVDAREAP
jgi:hypothetical protein